MKRVCVDAVLLLLFFCFAVPGTMAADGPDRATWYGSGTDGTVVVHLYFFWSRHCPHCSEARPVLQSLDEQYPWLVLHSMPVDDSAEHRRRYAQMASWFGEEARSVPAFFFCGHMSVGFESAQTSGELLRRYLLQCRDQYQTQHGTVAAAPINRPVTIQVPGVGTIDPHALSLPVLTILIGALDAFNPCAFFVLLFLLSLLVHARNQRRMLVVGGVFVFFSGALYFLFMAAWLNLFLIAGELNAVTRVAGMVAVILAGFNIKDYFRPGRGPTLSIPDGAKPGLFQRMRGLLQTERLPTLLLGTVTLAAAANSYELLCTSGLPMVYTRILTLRGLPESAYYGYLLLYNLIYVLPLMAIVLVFTFTLGSRKLQASEGRVLKLLSGLMMLGLGALLLVAPQGLDNLWVAAGLLLGAVVVTTLVHRVWRR